MVKDLSASALASGSYDTRAIVAEVAAAGKDNAAVTILPAYENQIKILLESEDHAKTGEFVINLGSDTVSPDLGADDDARDYPRWGYDARGIERAGAKRQGRPGQVRL